MLSENCEGLSQNTATMKDSIEEVVKISETGHISVTNLLDMNKKNDEYLKSFYDVVNNLIAKIYEINNFSSTIMKIARETKLLAFNASIEAAKAKESGKGFSVIAQSIKKLANESDLKAKEIQSALAEITKISEATVNELKLSQEVSTEKNTIVNETVDVFKTLKNTIMNSIEEINNVYNKTEQLIEIRNIVNSSMNEITDVTENNSVMTSKILDIIEESGSQMNQIISYIEKLEGESESLTKILNSLELS